MKLNSNSIIKALNLRPFGTKGWMNSSETKCPTCGKGDKFGILFTATGGATHCFYECGDNLSLYNYLKKIGRDDLIEHDQQISISNKVTELKGEKEQIEELPEIQLPKGFVRRYFSPYLHERNFKGYQYNQFEVGETSHFLEKKLWGNLIFVIKQKGKRVAYLSRSKKSKEWHKQNLENYKLEKEKLVLRYRNSEGTDFERILGGFDEITPNTEEVIIVEGLFDKTNISNHLETEKSERLKVVFTFGDSISNHQIDLLRETNVRRVILMYDPNTIRQSKKYSMELSKYFDVDVCCIEDEKIDPGNIDKKLLVETLSNSKNYLYFYTNKIATKIKSND